MALVVKSKVSNNNVITRIKETLSVGIDGTVKFRTNSGKGSGKGVIIPRAEWHEFMDLMKQADDKMQEVQDDVDETATEDADGE